MINNYLNTLHLFFHFEYTLGFMPFHRFNLLHLIIVFFFIFHWNRTSESLIWLLFHFSNTFETCEKILASSQASPDLPWLFPTVRHKLSFSPVFSFSGVRGAHKVVSVILLVANMTLDQGSLVRELQKRFPFQRINSQCFWFCNRAGVRCVTIASTKETRTSNLGPWGSKQRIADYHFRRKHKAKFI